MTTTANINVSHYLLPPRQLQEKVIEYVRAGALDGRLFLLQISEDLQHNWRETIPIVLETLADLQLS